jgi:hypothetical protein
MRPPAQSSPQPPPLSANTSAAFETGTIDTVGCGTSLPLRALFTLGYDEEAVAFVS